MDRPELTAQAQRPPYSLRDDVTTLTYLMTVGEATKNELAAAFEQLGPRAQDAIVTTVETIEERGLAVGKAGGRVAALIER